MNPEFQKHYIKLFVSSPFDTVRRTILKHDLIKDKNFIDLLLKGINPFTEEPLSPEIQKSVDEESFNIKIRHYNLEQLIEWLQRGEGLTEKKALEVVERIEELSEGGPK